MGAYQPLFNLSVEHTYFTDLVCRSLEFVPTASSAVILNKTGLLLRSSESGISVFYEEDKMDILRLHAADADGGLTLDFKVFSKDPYFAYYTTPSTKNEAVVLGFNNKQISRDEAGRQILHSDAYASELAFQDMTSAPFNGIFDQKDYLVKPNFIVQILVAADEQSLCSNAIDAESRRFHIRFAANKTFWKYYILGDLAKRKIYIADLDNEIKFDDIGNITLPGHRQAIMLQSTSAIPMQEAHAQRFQLRESVNIGDKVLIKRMPNACVSSIDGRMRGGEVEAISEIYIN